MLTVGKYKRLLVLVAVVIAAWLLYVLVWPFILYPTSNHRLGASYLDEVVIDGYSLEKESVEGDFQLNRFYLGPAVDDPLKIIHAPGIELTPLPPEQRSKNDLVELVAESGLPKAWPQCSMAVLRVFNRRHLDLSANDQARFDQGKLQILELSTACGGG